MINPILTKILSLRGHDTPEKLQDYLSDDLRLLPDLLGLKDITLAGQRIIEALKKREKIGIFGDYDVDGTTSCALFYRFFQLLNYDVELIQPSRFIEGYGIHAPSVEDAHNRGIKVLITVDCGITGHLACHKAKELGIDLIITDHHQDAAPEMPEAFAIINPNRRDEPKNSPLSALAGVGVAFALCWKIKDLLEKQGEALPSIVDLLCYVAIGTISDLAFLNPMNLKLCRHGLRRIKSCPYPGLRSFFSSEELSLPFIPSERISFHVGPLINSKGRLDHPEAALKLLTTNNEREANELYLLLKECNYQRRIITNQVFQEAKEQVIRDLSGQDHSITIAYAPHWHEGVIGIVASKLVEFFKVPAIVFTNGPTPDVLKASARSAGDMSIFELIKKSEHLLAKFGGHKGAAGLSIKKDLFSQFTSELNLHIKEYPEIIRKKFDEYDIEIKPEDISVELLSDLQRMEPFGMGNPFPQFCLKKVRINTYEILKEAHVRWAISSKSQSSSTSFKGISFNFLGKFNSLNPQELFECGKGQGVDVTFSLGINRFNGKEYLQLQVSQINPSLY